jgi:hypothetical protein
MAYNWKQHLHRKPCREHAVEEFLREQSASEVDPSVPAPSPVLRSKSPRNPRGVPIGLIIRGLRRKGWPHQEAIAMAFRIAQRQGMRQLEKDAAEWERVQAEGEAERLDADEEEE